jgi:aminoglycoside N3'-acetyltransferase
MSWDKVDFLQSLDSIGLKQNDILFIHSNLGLLGPSKTSENIANLALECLLEFLSGSGTLILPAFTYSHGNGQVFDGRSSGGIWKMGSLSVEAFNSNFFRSSDPMFSLLGNGPSARKLLANENFSSHGAGSAFRKIIDSNAKVLSVNMGAGSTLLHEIEYSIGVNYRFLKEFNCFVKPSEGSTNENLNWSAYVRKREISGSEASFNKLSKIFTKTGYWHATPLGRGYIATYACDKMESFLRDEILSDEWFLTKRGNVVSGMSLQNDID